MFPGIDVLKELERTGQKNDPGEKLVREAARILNDQRFQSRRVLRNLPEYNRSFEYMSEDSPGLSGIYSLAQIRKICTLYRLKFLPSRQYSGLIPQEASVRIDEINRQHRKHLRHFYVLGTAESFQMPTAHQGILFAETEQGNFYLVARWGKPLSFLRRLANVPFRTFETLAITLILTTLVLTLSLPTWLITLDRHAEYWSGYRAAAFFHLLIFNCGFTAFFMFAFSRNFNASCWNTRRDFG